MKSKLFELSAAEIAMVGGGSLDSLRDAYLGYYHGTPALEPVSSGSAPVPDTVDPAQQQMVYDAYAAYKR